MRVFPARALICAELQLPGRMDGRSGCSASMAILGDVVAEMAEICREPEDDRFRATIAHCEEMARSFNDAGIMAACFTSDTRETERAALLAEYRKPDSTLRVLLSVNALAKGFDVPDVGAYATCARFAKAWQSNPDVGARASIVAEYRQERRLLLDFSGNIIRMADDYSDVFYNGLDALDNGEKLDKTIRRDKEENRKGKPARSADTSRWASAAYRADTKR